MYNWVILSVILMCHKAVFHVFSPSHSSQACCKWIPYVAQASEKEQSDLVSHPAAVQAADSDPGLALPALTLHFLQSGLMTLSLGSASASGLGCSSLSQETSTPFTAQPQWPCSYPNWGMWCHKIINKSWGVNIYCRQTFILSCSNLCFYIFSKNSTLFSRKQITSSCLVFKWISVLAEANHGVMNCCQMSVCTWSNGVVLYWAEI